MSTETLTPPKTKSQALRSYDVADFPALTGREEEWRFTPLARLRDLATATAAVDAAVVTLEHDALPAGVTVSAVKRGDPLVGTVLTPFDRISALAYGGFTEAHVIAVARETVLDA